jgi:protein-tyrosine phosphatase
MYKILDNLATHGIGEPGILKGYSECKQGSIDNFRIIDVRTLVDGPNPSFDYELSIMRVISNLEIDEKVVICCRLGISRSNAIALGVLVHYFKIEFDQALELIISKVPICNILTPHILALQKLFNIRYTRCLKTDTLSFLGYRHTN